MIGRQLPLIALFLPFYVMALYGGFRSVRALWPVLLVAGGSFAVSQFVASNVLDYALTDVLASLGSLAVTLLFLRVWRPRPDPEFMIAKPLGATRQGRAIPSWQGWVPWLLVSALMLATGTAILVAAILTAAIFRVSPSAFLACAARTVRQAWLAVLTVMFIVGLAYLMNYAGLAYTLGEAAASAGQAFVLLSPFLGWIAVFLSGSDTSGNALFGNLQVVAARQLGLNPVLFAAANSSGGVMGKMISPQNIATGVAVTDLKGREGVVFARTFRHSVILTLILGLLVAFEQYVIPGIIPG
jgi:lactate permease